MAKRNSGNGKLQKVDSSESSQGIEYTGRDFMGNEGGIRYTKTDTGHKLEIAARDNVGNKGNFKAEW